MSVNARIAATSPDYNSTGGVAKAVDDKDSYQIASASGAISVKEGTVSITKAGVAALTLVAPTAGLPSAGGDDGKVLRIVSETANAHTITTPAAGINGNKNINTFSATLPNACEFVARNGTWWSTFNTGGTLSGA
ncbi:MAG: hypothetical protein JWN34_2034 [Bryobacterales bacterium]|nr:hypothetical protein [Bryobacterales bacterium]